MSYLFLGGSMDSKRVPVARGIQTVRIPVIDEEVSISAHPHSLLTCGPLKTETYRAEQCLVNGVPERMYRLI